MKYQYQVSRAASFSRFIYFILYAISIFNNFKWVGICEGAVRKLGTLGTSIWIYLSHVSLVPDSNPGGVDWSFLTGLVVSDRPTYILLRTP